MEKLKFRTLKADEIECRVGTANESGVSVLLYKDARVDMRLLDEVVGAYNWKREHEIINGNLYCTVSIYNQETKEWVSKQDVGVESNTEKEKGQASDAFKRACFNWGIGRELYTSPFVWINLAPNEWRANGRRQPAVKFHVDTLEYQDGKVTKLIIKDESGKERFSFPYSGRSYQPNTQNNPNLTLEDKLGAALLDVEACKSVQELEALYHAYKAELGSDSRFLGALKQKKESLIKKVA